MLKILKILRTLMIWRKNNKKIDIQNYKILLWNNTNNKMNYNYSNEVSEFIKDILAIRCEYEKTQTLSEDFILLIKCITFFNEKRNNKQLINEMQNNLKYGVDPAYLGDGYDFMNDDCLNYSSDSDLVTSTSSKSSTSSVVTIKNEDLIDNHLNENNSSEEEIFNISDDEKDDKDVDEDDVEKVNKMLAISKILLNKAVRNKMIITENIPDDDSDNEN